MYEVDALFQYHSLLHGEKERWLLYLVICSDTMDYMLPYRNCPIDF